MSENEIQRIIDSIEDLHEDVTQKNEEGYRRLYDKIEETRKTLTDQILILSTETDKRFTEINFRCKDREQTYIDGKEFLRRPQIGFTDMINSTVGKITIVLISVAVYEIIRQLIAGIKLP